MECHVLTAEDSSTLWISNQEYFGKHGGSCTSNVVQPPSTRTKVRTQKWPYPKGTAVQCLLRQSAWWCRVCIWCAIQSVASVIGPATWNDCSMQSILLLDQQHGMTNRHRFTTLRLPWRSPIQVLTGHDVTLLQWSTRSSSHWASIGRHCGPLAKMMTERDKSESNQNTMWLLTSPTLRMHKKEIIGPIRYELNQSLKVSWQSASLDCN